jgi:hypothetical protein
MNPAIQPLSATILILYEPLVFKAKMPVRQVFAGGWGFKERKMMLPQCDGIFPPSVRLLRFPSGDRTVAKRK